MDVASTTRPLDWLADFPAIPKGWAYLDSAATAQKPQSVIDAITRGYAETYATVHRGVEARVAPARAENDGDEAGALADLGAVGEADEAGFTKHAPVEHEPCALAQAGRGEAIGPAGADERLHHRGLSPVVEGDLGGEVIGGLDVDFAESDGTRRASALVEPAVDEQQARAGNVDPGEGAGDQARRHLLGQ